MSVIHRILPDGPRYKPEINVHGHRAVWKGANEGNLKKIEVEEE